MDDLPEDMLRHVILIGGIIGATPHLCTVNRLFGRCMKDIRAQYIEGPPLSLDMRLSDRHVHVSLGREGLGVACDGSAPRRIPHREIMRTHSCDMGDGIVLRIRSRHGLVWIGACVPHLSADGTILVVEFVNRVMPDFVQRTARWLRQHDLG